MRREALFYILQTSLMLGLRELGFQLSAAVFGIVQYAVWLEYRKKILEPHRASEKVLSQTLRITVLHHNAPFLTLQT